jgi:hypothetical protein
VRLRQLSGSQLNKFTRHHHFVVVKILFVTNHFGFLRNFEPAIRLLAERGHSVNLTADRGDSVGGMRTVEGLVRDYPERITYERAPSPKLRPWSALARGIRLSLDYWRYLDSRYDRAPKLRDRAADQAPRFARSLVKLPLFRIRLGRRALMVSFRLMERVIPAAATVRRFLSTKQPDVILITPLIYFGSSQVDYVRAARRLRIPSVLCVGSWDHLTTKGLIHDLPDHVTVWNNAQLQEANELHGISTDRVTVTGAQAYDHWFTARPSVDRVEFCRRIGLVADRPILLYLCSSKFIAPNEVDFVKRWLGAIRGHTKPLVQDANVLIRPHPQNFEQWRGVDVSGRGPVAIWPHTGANPVDAIARANYFDSMHYSALVVGVNTSALIESGIVGRSVYTVLAPEFAGTQDGTFHFQHLRHERGGLLHVAENLEEHLEQVEHGLTQPVGLDKKSRNFIEGFIRPGGLDRPAAATFVDAIEAASRNQLPSRFDPVWVPVLRVCLRPVASIVQWLNTQRTSPVAVAAAKPRRGPNTLRAIFTMASPEYLRYYDSTIRLFAERGHEVIIAVGHFREKKRARLEEVEADGEGIQLAGCVPRRGDIWEPIARGLRGLIDYVRYFHPRFAGAPALRARMKRKVLPLAFWPLDIVGSLSVGSVRRILRLLGTLEAAIPSSRRLEDWLRSYDPDIVLVSPLVDAASPQVDLIKSAQALGLRTGACVASWDNLTNKGLMRVEPDLVLVWNEIQKAEAVELHGIHPAKVTVTGAQLFDRWFERQPSRDRTLFCRTVGLADDRPFVLFTGSSGFISESHAEVAFVRTWIRALRESPDSGVRSLAVLVRPHPYNTEAWEMGALSDLSNVSVWPCQRYNPVDEGERETYFESIYYGAAVIGINTSAMLEAAIIGRPVLSILTREFAATQEGTLHFHYLRRESGGCVHVAVHLKDHIQQLADVLKDPETTREETRKFLVSFIRPHGLDKPCTPIITDSIERLARRESAKPVPVKHSRLLALSILLPSAAIVGCVAFIARGPRMLRSLRKAVRSRTHRLRKAIVRSVRAASRRVARTFIRSPLRLTRLVRRFLWQSLRRVVLQPVRGVLRLVRHGRYRAALFVKHRTDPDLKNKS